MNTRYFQTFSGILILNLLSISLFSCTQKNAKPIPELKTTTMNETNKTIDTATFGEGCFWCVEAVFQQLEGVISVTSGYSGGQTKNPTYKEVCSGETGHAEVCQIVFDPTKITYANLLQAFWGSHNSTTLNRQGNDVGTQYRSVIFYHNASQKEQAEKYKKELDASGSFTDPIVTEIAPLEVFYKAEEYHQNYYNQNGNEGYCQIVIKPKLEKFQHVFKDKLKKKTSN